MQLTLDDLRKASDPLAALLAMSDSDLDQVAAEIQKLQRRDYRTSEYGVWSSAYYDCVTNEKVCDFANYQPSRNLDQAYELLNRCPTQWWSEYDDEAGRFWALEPHDLIVVYESQAGSHARAVVVLAILGLLGKDGGA